MIKELGLKAMAVPTLAALGLALAAGPASASWVSGFSGYSVFGGGAIPCALCDSANDFAVWRNDGQTGNWATDLGLTPQIVNGTNVDINPIGSPTWSGGVDTTSDFVFFYQVFNNDPLDVSNPPLQDFNISVEYKPPLPHPDPVNVPNPFTSGGYITDDKDLYTTTAPQLTQTPDDPFTWSPTDTTIDPNLPDSTPGVAPSQIDYELISSPSVLAGAVFPGINFTFGTTEIPTDGKSAILFLTSDLGPGYVWAETQSSGGFGAAGDVPGVKLPEPGTLGLLGFGLLGLGFAARRQKRA